MAKGRKKRKKLKNSLKYELYGIIILILSVIALASEGSVGHSFTYMFRFLVGSWDFVIPLFFIYIGLSVMWNRKWPRIWTTRKTGVFLFVLGLLIMSHIGMFNKLKPDNDYSASYIVHQTWITLKDGMFATDKDQDLLNAQVGGGMIGAFCYAAMFFLFGPLGARLTQLALFVIGVLLFTGLSYVDSADKLRTRIGKLAGHFRTRAKELLHMVRLKRSGGRPSAVKGKPRTGAVQPPPFYDDELDEENYRPAPKKAAKPSFFDLFKQKPSSMNNDEDDEDEEDEDGEGAVAGAAASPSPAAPPAFAHPQEEEDEESPIPVIRDFQEHVRQTETDKEPAGMRPKPDAGSPAAASAPPLGADEPHEHGDAIGFAEAKVPAKPYQMPAFSLLSRPAGGKNGEMLDYKATARKLEATLESFGVRAKVLEVVKGPSVTRYEIQPDIGVKVSRIVSLTDDIALALAAKDIRMEAPIPGKSAIGIEVPNTEVSIVTMREVMESSAFHESNARLTIALGRDISGQPIVGNLAKMPHLLVAGATGSGKSVCINGIIVSILYKAKPNEVKFLMIDPKMVELNVYNGIPHLLAPVVTDPRRASLSLKKVVKEMEGRYEMFSKSGTRNIEGYNTLIANGTIASEPLPYIVVIVDELADLMMVAAGDVEDAICRLAQMARAAGIHLIIATQRPSVDVITGVIKANIPSRIAFGVSSQVDSRTILDMVGAEKLLGRGDMLFLPVGASKPVRVQGAFLSDQEVESVVNFVSHQEKAEYREEMVPEIEETTEDEDEYVDELFDQAVQIVLEAKQASVSLLQRRMRVGYTRAARLIDTMEAKGIVGPYEGSKPREVLTSLEQYHNRSIS